MGALPADNAHAAGAFELATSFRDPDGVVVSSGGRILRIIRPGAEAEVLEFLGSALAASLGKHGRLVTSRILNPDLDSYAGACLEQLGGGTAIEHERVPFVAFPYEWPPEMLHAAAKLTLELARESQLHGYGLKDATPYNVLFRGPKPVFIDLLSFERRDAGDPTWLPYAQFVRTFLLPLAVTNYYGLRLDQMLTTRRDGLEPEEVYRLLKAHHKFQPPFLSLVSIPKWLGSRVDQDETAIYRKKIMKDAEEAQFILSSVFAGLGRSLRRVAPGAGKSSVWSEYKEGGQSYSGGEFAAKQAFVDEALREHRPRRVLDVGCNTGHFSLLAAGTGASVVSIDQDPVVVGETWRAASSRGADVLPLVVDLCRPTPATGWWNRENPSFLERARGSFDAVLMLAVLHHMMVTERVPLDDVLKLASELTTDLLIIEFVGPDDPMFRRLLRGRDDLHRGLTTEFFESTCRRRFEILRSRRLEGADRWMYLLRRKN